jgi:hypothetical protein
MQQSLDKDHFKLKQNAKRAIAGKETPRDQLQQKSPFGKFQMGLLQPVEETPKESSPHNHEEQ